VRLAAVLALSLAATVPCAAAGAAPADLDSSFGTGGMVAVEPPPGVSHGSERTAGMAIGPGGEIYVVYGSAELCGPPFDCKVELNVARFEPDGSRDESFGTATTPPFPVPGEIGRLPLGVADGTDGEPVIRNSAVAVQPDGKVLVAEERGRTPTWSELVVARHLTTGELDPGFGSGGESVLTLPTQSRPDGILLGADGTITVPGPNFHGGTPLFGEGFSAPRLLPDGQLDPSWAGTGVPFLPTPGAQASVEGAALTPAGGLVLAFEEATETVATTDNLVELGPDGSLEPHFGSAGRLRLYPRVGALVVDDLGVDAQGRIVGAGWLGGAEVFRLRPDGSADRTFNGGKSLFLAHGADRVLGLGLQPGGRIVVLVWSESRGRSGFSLVGLRGGTDRTRCLGHPATIVGTQGADTIVGTPHRDVIAGLGGADTIRGLGGPDVICGGKGRDKIYPGPGRNVVRP
jgi:uncharacterized delta-60 repeat protein